MKTCPLPSPGIWQFLPKRVGIAFFLRMQYDTHKRTEKYDRRSYYHVIRLLSPLLDLQESPELA